MYPLESPHRGDSNDYTQYTHRGDSNEYAQHAIIV